ncbi:MAG: type II toxin-antitoxin system VapC family toxin [Gammaproteobacteria bacterium]|nr:type II toxin-antitoxin system VapC family toxin [Gammaproteobacteria bacterium]
MRYLLDTDTCIFAINRRPGYERVLARMDGLLYGQVLISVVTLCELEAGIAKSTRQDHNRRRIEHFIARLEVAPLDEPAAKRYGDVRAFLERRGKQIGPLDTLIAAHALSMGAILVSNNTSEFSRVSGLRLQNWVT